MRGIEETGGGEAAIYGLARPTSTKDKALMLKQKWFWVCVLVPLYAVTWIGGWILYARQLKDRTESGYRAVQHDNEVEEAAALRGGWKPYLAKLHPDGPKSAVNLCLPILPGVLLADSYESIGPLDGQGGWYIVLYNGFSTTRVCMLWGWLA